MQRKLKEEKKAKKEGIEHINFSMQTGTRTPMYNCHRFFSRKPANIVSEYIKHYSKENDIVLDPFCGSGVTISEALIANRRAIGIDLAPMAIFITKMSTKPIDLDKYTKEFKKIESKLKNKLNSFYITKCRKCGKETIAINYIWDSGDIVEVGYECEKCKVKVRKPIENFDKRLLKNVEKNKIAPHPTNKLYYEDGSPFKEKQKYESVDQLFTKRNLIALSLLFQEINAIKDNNVKELMRYTFTSMAHLASRMTPDRETRPFSSFWGEHSYWYANRFMESNAWRLFENAYSGKQGVLKAKDESNSKIMSYKEAKNFDNIEKEKANIWLLNESAIDGLKKIPPNSVDYIFTDPPYGGSIQYGELTYMWDSWLSFAKNFNERVNEEIIINKWQHKDFDKYYSMIYPIFAEIFRVLKGDKYVTVTFHNPDIKIRNAIVRIAILVGFDYEKILYQEPPRPSAKALTQPFGSLFGDYYLRFKKPKHFATIKQQTNVEIDEARYKNIVIDTATKIIAHRGEPTPFTFIQNSIDPLIYKELKKHGLLLQYKPESIEKILKNKIGEIFKLVDVKIGSKKGKVWWFKDPNRMKIDIIPLNKRVEETIISFFNKKYKASFSEILTELFTRYKNSLTPESQSVREILNRIAKPIGKDMWILKPIVNEMRKQHEEMVYYLGRIGRKAGFDISIASDEWGKSYDGKTLAELLKLKKKLVLKGIPDWNMNRIQRIDILWYKGNEIFYEFEIENSTNIIDSIIRGSNIQSEKTKRLIVIPKTYEGLMNKVFNEPEIIEMVDKYGWKIITFENLRRFFNKVKSEKMINEDDIIKISRKPREETKSQKKLLEF